MQRKEYNTVNIPPTAKPQFSRVAETAATLGAIGALAIAAATLPAVLLIPSLRAYLPLAVVAAITAGGLAAAGGGAYFVLRSATAWLPLPPRPATSIPQAQPQPLALSAHPSEPAALQLAARRILEIHFLAGLDATRPECQSMAGILQTDWNLINQAFKACGIKAERRWLVDDHAQALTLWIACVRIDADRSVWVRSHPDSGRWMKVNRVLRV